MGFLFNGFGSDIFSFMVYKVLRDDYKTDKTFDHFYEDKPIDPFGVSAENESEKFRL